MESASFLVTKCVHTNCANKNSDQRVLSCDFQASKRTHIFIQIFIYLKSNTLVNTTVVQHPPWSPLGSSDLTSQPTVKSREQAINKMAMNQTATGSLKEIRILNQHKYPVFNAAKQLVRIIGLWIWITSPGSQCREPVWQGRAPDDLIYLQSIFNSLWFMHKIRLILRTNLNSKHIVYSVAHTAADVPATRWCSPNKYI